ncbi:27125_t:CDS:2, partial [Dentiscutata erythropus]
RIKRVHKEPPVILRALLILPVMDSFDYLGGGLFRFWTLLILPDFENQKSPQELPVILRALSILPVVDSFDYPGSGLFRFWTLLILPDF